MKKHKKPLGCGNIRAAKSKACAENLSQNDYIKFSAKCKPQSGRGRRCPPPMFWELIPTTIGIAWLTRQLFRIVDLIER